MSTAGDAPDPAETIELPAGTAWPMVVGLGVTLVFAGLVTHTVVSAVGLLLGLIAGVGWWRQVLPVERVEHARLRPAAERARPIAPSGTVVERLTAGEALHRVRVPVAVQPYSAGVRGGLTGGAAMAVIALAYGLLFQGSLWYPVNLLSAVAMPSLAQGSDAALRAFNPGALAVGIIAHGVISVLAGLLYAVILPMLPRRHVLWGGVIAPLLWTGLLWAVLGVINPTLNARVDWLWFVASQIAFGLAAGFVVGRAQPIATMQTWPLVARAGVKAPGVGAAEDRAP